MLTVSNLFQFVNKAAVPLVIIVVSYIDAFTGSWYPTTLSIRPPPGITHQLISMVTYIKHRVNGNDKNTEISERLLHIRHHVFNVGHKNIGQVNPANYSHGNLANV